MTHQDDYEDKELTCAETGCGTFNFTAGEQKFYEEKDFTPPKRCKFHREAARKQRDASKVPATDA